jgi:hypothetical protein
MTASNKIEKEAVHGEIRQFRELVYICIHPGSHHRAGIWKQIIDGIVNDCVVADYTLCCQLDLFGQPPIDSPIDTSINSK